MINTTLQEEMYSRIRAHGDKSFFTPADFEDLGDKMSILTSLQELSKTCNISRVFITEHIFLYRTSQEPLDNEYSLQDYKNLVLAMSKLNNCTIIPAKEFALYFFKLTDKLPETIPLVTNGENYRYEGNDFCFDIQHQDTPPIGKVSFMTDVLIQLLLFIGKGKLTEEQVNTLKANLFTTEKNKMYSEISVVFELDAWIKAETQKICKKGK